MARTKTETQDPAPSIDTRLSVPRDQPVSHVSRPIVIRDPSSGLVLEVEEVAIAAAIMRPLTRQTLRAGTARTTLWSAPTGAKRTASKKKNTPLLTKGPTVCIMSLMCNSAAHNSRPGRESLSKRLGASVVRALRERDGGRCVYCGQTAEQSGTHLQLDHIEPKNLGGSDAPSNLIYACRRCNSARQDLSLAEWARYAARKYGVKFEPRKVRDHARRQLVDPKTGLKVAA